MKEKKKRQSIKLDKMNRRINIFIVCLVIFYLINNLVMYLNDNYAYYFTVYVTNNINGIFYYLGSFVPYLSYILSFLYFITVIIYLGVDIYFEAISKADFDMRSRVVNTLYRVFIIFSMIIIIPSYIGQFSNHLPNFDTLYFKNSKDKTYTAEDLIELDKYIQKQVLAISDNIKRNDNAIDIKVDYIKQAQKDLLNVSDEIKLLKGFYPQASSPVNNFIRGVLGSKVVGLTIPYSTYFDYEAANTSVINTVTHEFCHTKGILRESEAVYCSFVAGINSDNELSRYAAYIEAFSWISEALLNIEPEIADALEDEVLSRCLTKDYPELCELYTKNNTEYINGANTLRIASYRLKNYQGYEDLLVNSLQIFYDNGSKITVGDKSVSIDEIKELIKEGSSERIVIVLNLDKRKFENIKEAIKDKRLYLSIYQRNKDDGVSKDKIKDPVKYYLAPFKDRDEHIFFNANYGAVEYEYSRVARLLLEHYEKNGNYSQ